MANVCEKKLDAKHSLVASIAWNVFKSFSVGCWCLMENLLFARKSGVANAVYLGHSYLECTKRKCRVLDTDSQDWWRVARNVGAELLPRLYKGARGK